MIPAVAARPHGPPNAPSRALPAPLAALLIPDRAGAAACDRARTFDTPFARAVTQALPKPPIAARASARPPLIAEKPLPIRVMNGIEPFRDDKAVRTSVIVVKIFIPAPAIRVAADVKAARPSAPCCTGAGSALKALTACSANCTMLRRKSLAPEPLLINSVSKDPPSFSRSPFRLSIRASAVSAAYPASLTLSIQFWMPSAPCSYRLDAARIASCPNIFLRAS